MRPQLRLAPLVLSLVVIAACSPEPPTSGLGPYMWFEDYFPYSYSYIRPDATGIPEVRYSDIGWRPNPTTTAQWGLAEHARLLKSGSKAERQNVILAAEWLIEHQTNRGVWEYDFPFSNGLAELSPPWISALAQGNAMSLLARAYELTGDERYLVSARRAFEPFTVSVADGGVLAYFDGLPFYEEYPHPTGSTHVLNGMIFALAGLSDLHAISGDATAGEFYLEGLASVRELMGLFEVETEWGWWPTYDLAHLVAPGRAPKLATEFYSELHSKQLAFLLALTGDEYYSEVDARWSASLRARRAGN